ncbi:uncharacterized protein [Temnothorax longispinosus]|uniref:uncharacterized protein isoform X2 n=1 Tax=Temnothorax longispinosus TaxID=300112 RepID=UPI003A9A0DC4
MSSTEYAELKRIDELLQCGICYEYMDTSVITSCSHSYCSLCIRKYLHYKTQCPICSEETYEKDLRKNKLLDEIIIHYLNFKEKHDKKSHDEKLLTAKNDNSEIVCSTSNFECKKEQDDLNAIEVSHKSCDSPTLAAGNTTPRGRKDYQQDVSTPSTSTDLRIPSMFTPKSRKGFLKEDRQVVTCPVCKVEVPQCNINRHLDDCLKRENTKDQPKKSEPKRKPLPKLVLSLMKDSVIRKRLKESGLSSQGDRKTLESRLQKYTVLYNAECDKTHPRPVPELIKQCEEEENLEKKVQKLSNRLNVNRNTDHNVIEQQRKKYQNDSTIKDAQKTDFLLLNSANYIEDSDSNISCPLQTCVSDNPMDFLTVELASSSNDSIDQCASNHDISNHLNKTSPDLFNSTINTENIEIEKPSESILTREEITFDNRSRQCNVLENKMDIDNKRSVSELTEIETENGEQTKLFKKRKSDTMYSSDKCVAYSEPRDRWQKELHNEDIDSITEDIEHIDEDSDSDIDIQEDYERLKHEQLNKAMEYASGSTKFEKENMKALDKDLTTWTSRKREREMAFVLSDEENIADRTINARKSPRLGLSEVKGFNNENFGETARDEEKSQSEKEQSQVIRTNNIRNFARKSVRLRNKMSNEEKKIKRKLTT